jgi:hypothetical protein
MEKGKKPESTLNTPSVSVIPIVSVIPSTTDSNGTIRLAAVYNLSHLSNTPKSSSETGHLPHLKAL